MTLPPDRFTNAFVDHEWTVTTEHEVEELTAPVSIVALSMPIRPNPRISFGFDVVPQPNGRRDRDVHIDRGLEAFIQGVGLVPWPIDDDTRDAVVPESEVYIRSGAPSSNTPPAFDPLSLSKVLETFAVRHDFVGRDLDVAISALAELRLATFGSPPDTFATLTALAEKSPFVAITGISLYEGQPMIAVVAGLSLSAVWFATPVAKIMRRSVAEKVARKMGVTMEDSDEN